jgi:predicted nucleic acid-binding protein
MNSVVLDASFIVKLVAEEPGSQRCWETLEELDDAERLVPAHATAEVVEVVRRKLRRGMIARAQFDDAVSFILGVARPVPLQDLVRPAADMALERGITVYDALYIALAIRAEALLLTADLKLVDRLRGTPLEPVVLGVGPG